MTKATADVRSPRSQREDDAAAAAAAGLLLINLYDIVVLHFESFGRIVIVDPFTVEEKPQRSHRNPLAFAVE